MASWLKKGDGGGEDKAKTSNGKEEPAAASLGGEKHGREREEGEDARSGKKRKVESSAAASSAGSSASSSSRPVFLLSAGAGGVLPKDSPVEWLEQVGKVVCPAIPGQKGYDETIGIIRGGNGCKPATLKRYHHAVEKVAEDHPGRDVWLVGQSFGNRLAVHYLTGTTAVNTARTPENPVVAPAPWAGKPDPPSSVRGMICLGYPLHHATQVGTGGGRGRYYGQGVY